MIPVTKTFLPPFKDYVDELEEVWKSGWLTNGGEKQKKFLGNLRDYFGNELVETVSNGTLALQLALKGLGVGEGEVITTPYSYVATTTAILWERCTPVFVDVDESYCINPNLIESAITKNTKAILATHVYGLPCDVDAIDEIAKKYGLKVIYDAAHAMGCRMNGQHLSSFGDASALSFHATKLMHSIEGGAVVCRDKSVFERVSMYAKFGHKGEDVYIQEGINAKLSEMHAAMGILTLKKLPNLISERKNLKELYDKLLADELVRIHIPKKLEYNYAYYPVFFKSYEDMNFIREQLQIHEIFPRRYFYPSLNTLPYLKNKIECPQSESLSSRVLCLPLYNGLEDSQVVNIVSIVNCAISRKR